MPATPKYIPNGIPYITSKNIKNGSLDFESANYISLENYNKMILNRKIEKNDILISMIGTIGEVAIVNTNNRFYGQNIYLVRLNNNIILNKYYYYYITQRKIKNNLILKKNTSSQGYIKAGMIDEMRIPVPPLEVQNEIVRILDNFTLLTAELESELENRKKQYEYYRDNIMINTKNTKKYKLSEISKIYDGTHQTPKYTSVGTNFISVENINNIYNSRKYISNEDYKKYKIKPEINDVFMTRIGTIGKCAVFYKQEDLAYYVSLALIRPNSKIVDSHYLRYLIESIIGIKELRKRTLINAVPIKINKDDIGKIILPIPTIEEQQKIVTILDKFDKLCNDICEGLPAEIEARKKQYEYYRDKLLTFK